MTDDHGRPDDDPETQEEPAQAADAAPSSGSLRLVPPPPDSAGPKVAADGDDDDPPPPSGPRPARGPGLSEEVIAEFVCREGVRKQLFARVYDAIKSGYRRQEAEDFVDEICLACIASRTPPASEAVLLGWIHSVATFTLADINREFFKEKPHRRRWNEKKMEGLAEPWREDEEAVEAWMITPWLIRAVAGDAQAAETLWILRYKANTGKTWAQVGKERGETEDQLRMRCNRLAVKYGPARKKYVLQLTLLTVFLLVFVAVALAALVRAVTTWSRPPHESITRDVPTARPEIPDAFPQALPTQPMTDASAPPKEDKPVAPPTDKRAPDDKPGPDGPRRGDK